MCRERGQATIEWAGLVLLVALALGALATVVPLGDQGLGVAVAERIGCAVRDGCAAAAGADRSRPSAIERPSRREQPHGLPTGVTRPPAPVPPSPSPRLGAVRPPPLPGELARRFPRLARVADLLGRKAWIACFGYESFLFDLRHRARVNPNLTMSPSDALGIANSCLNPYSFVPHG
jgi:hypothetical protein